ncbi:MAG: ABC transporter [Nitrospirae bacterium]|nr:MAG: ABC transporter [Nitrospirota bacterium]
MKRQLLTGTGLVVGAVLFAAVNVLSDVTLRGVRFDLTEHHLYTLSDGTKNILKNLDEPITLRLYLSEKLATGLPGIKSYTVRVKEMLEEFEELADGKIRLQVIDPEPFSEEEDRAVAYGLQAVPLDGGNTQFYFGLVGTNSTDDQEIIPFFQPEREQFLEYDLAKLVYRLAHPKKPVVGLLTSLPLEGSPSVSFLPQSGQPPWLILDHIRQLFDIRTIQPRVREIPEDIDILMIVHPKDLSESLVYAIDQFILRGGRALIFVDPLSEADMAGASRMNPMGAQGPRDSDLPKLFEAWGIELVKGKVVGDLPLAKKVQIQQQARIQVVDYPIWIGLRQEHFNPEDPVTAQISSLTMASAGALQKKHPSSETTDPSTSKPDDSDANSERYPQFIPLVQTDDRAMLIDVSQVSFLPDVPSLLRAYQPSGVRYTLAARITGKVKSAFPDGPPAREESDHEDNADPGDTKNEKETDSPKEHLAESKDPINVIVVADTDLLQDRFWVQVQNFFGQRIGIPTAGNGTFVANALDNLGGSNDLISIRGRVGYSRPFTLVRALQQEAEQQFRQKEQALQDRLKELERRIQELQSEKDQGSALILSAAQQEEIARFRRELVQVRKELRQVQHELVKDIESLESWVKFLNIGFVPLLIGVAGVVVSLSKHRRKRRPA